MTYRDMVRRQRKAAHPHILGHRRCEPLRVNQCWQCIASNYR
eukprot:CAMPEP_0180685598 /NCGR_PEP_ID=MMETSP1037_2-20121125/72493_1 /TAXON_ID=632150 /ORGANISM="Azadinium spinosum, Strain 3D9" /LENGTH=41 /DNA_ID= /DNA_START= /DNA_END= /DNA_ORIENTATION=